jgi:integrase
LFNCKESKSTQLQRVAALKLFLVESQGFALNFKDFSKKSEVKRIGHKALDDKTIKLVKQNAKEHSLEMLVFISLLLDMAARAQDVIGIPYGLILEGKQHQKNQIYEVNLEPKKTDGRIAFVTKDTRSLVKLLMIEQKDQEQDIMFALGEKKENPYEMWTKRVNRFLSKNFERQGITTHDFRKTAATNLYKQTKGDIVKV